MCRTVESNRAKKKEKNRKIQKEEMKQVEEKGERIKGRSECGSSLIRSLQSNIDSEVSSNNY